MSVFSTSPSTNGSQTRCRKWLVLNYRTRGRGGGGLEGRGAVPPRSSQPQSSKSQYLGGRGVGGEPGYGTRPFSHLFSTIFKTEICKAATCNCKVTLDHFYTCIKVKIKWSLCLRFVSMNTTRCARSLFNSNKAVSFYLWKLSMTFFFTCFLPLDNINVVIDSRDLVFTYTVSLQCLASTKLNTQ